MASVLICGRTRPDATMALISEAKTKAFESLE